MGRDATRITSRDREGSPSYFAGLPTWNALTAAITPAANKYHLVVGNGLEGNQSVILLGLWCYNGVAAVTGAINEFQLMRLASYGTPTGGGAAVIDPNDSGGPTLANVSVYGGATGGLGADGAVRRILNISTEEHTATVADVDRLLEEMNRLDPGCATARPLILRPGEAAAVKQIGAGTAGTLRWRLLFAVEAD